MSKDARSDSVWLAMAWLVAAVAIVLSRGPAADTHHRVKESEDVYVLPPPEVVSIMSLGHRAAVADYLWATVLVEQGLHTVDRRRFSNMFLLVDTINELDPTFRKPYLLIDPLTIFQVNGVPIEDVRRARAIMERGVRNLPNDPEMLVAAGSFIGLMAPSSYLEDPEEKLRWKLDGARLLARAAELGDDKKNIGWQALSGVSLLKKAGKKREAVQFLEHALAGTDDPELRDHIKKMLAGMAAAEEGFEKDEQKKALAAFRERRKHFEEYFVKVLRDEHQSMTAALVLGPPYDVAYCAGGTHSDDVRCAHTWLEWDQRLVVSGDE